MEEPVVRRAAAAGDDDTATTGAERDARATELLHLAFDHAPVGVALLGPPPRWATLAVNSTLAEMLGYSATELVDLEPRRLTVPDDWALETAERERIVTGEVDGVSLDKRYVRKDGSAFPGRLEIVVARRDSGEVAYGVGFVEDVTPRHRSEELFRAAAEASLDEFALLAAEREPDGRVVDFVFRYGNSLAGRSLATTPAEMVGLRFTELVPPEFRPGLFDAFCRVVESGEPLQQEYSIELHGRTCWFQQQVVPVEDGIAVTSRDITARREALEALRANRERFEALVQHSWDLVAVMDTDGIPTYLSPSHETVLGRPLTDFTGKRPTEIVHPDDRAMVPRLREALFAEPGAHVRTHFRIRHGDGSWRVFEATLTNLLHDPSVGGVVLNARDVTDAAAALAALRESEDRFQALARHSSDVVCVLARDGRARYVSPAVTRVLGYREDEFSQPLMTAFAHPDEQPAWRAHFEETLEYPGREHTVELRIRHADGRWVWHEIRATNLLDQPAVNGVVVHLRDISERRSAEDEMSRQALHDPLTALPNRALLLDRLARSLARGSRTGLRTVLLFIDLDRFKIVNDSLGHAHGDELLVAVAARLRSSLREVDTVARLGGDEFVVLLEDTTHESVALDVGEKLLESLRRPFRLAGREFFVTASIGMAISGSQNETPESMIRDADAAMYVAKGRGRNRLEVFDEAIRVRVMRNLEMEHDLHRAVERQELRLVYQPIYNLRSRRVVGVEALLRWDHPRRGLMLPGEFIGVAEETGLVVPIGEWVIDQACRQRRSWHGVDPTRSFRTVWVNLSARQLTRPELATVIRDSLARHEIRPDELGLELTESALIEEIETVGTELRDIESLGVRLAIDDFGTGYSSLLYLRRYHVDLLRLDRSFVSGAGTNADDTAIARAIINLGHTLGIEVSAEGVETELQMDTLRALGCDSACGHLLVRPTTPEIVTELLELQPPGDVPA